MQSVRLVPFGLNTQALIEDLYTQVCQLRAENVSGYLLLDLSAVSFIPPDGMLAIVTIARLWHRWTGYCTILTNMQYKVHRYLERMDLFTTCGLWIKQDRELLLEDRFERSSESTRLLEVVALASNERQNAHLGTDTGPGTTGETPHHWPHVYRVNTVLVRGGRDRVRVDQHDIHGRCGAWPWVREQHARAPHAQYPAPATGPPDRTA